MEVVLPTVFKVCWMTPYPPQDKGDAEHAYMYVEAFRRSPFQRQLELHLISEITEKCPRSRTFLYSPEENFTLERVYPDRFPYSNVNFLRIFKAILKSKPQIAHFYWPGSYGGLLKGWVGEPLLLLFALLRLSSIKVALTMRSVFLPQYVEKVAYERTRSRIVAKAAKAYFFVFTFILCHLANIVLIAVIREDAGITKRFAYCHKISKNRIGEEPAGYVRMKLRDHKTVQEIKERLNLTGKKVILSFGFIRPDKGYEYAIRALAQIVGKDQNVRLIIAGKAKSKRDLKYLNNLKRLVSELDLGNYVIFDSRFIPREEVIDYYSAAETLVLPYTEHIGYSGPLTKAISSAVPTITTSVGQQMPGLAELIKLVPPRDVEALKNALDEILSNTTFRDKAKAKLLSHMTRYSWPKIAQRLINMYVRILAE